MNIKTNRLNYVYNPGTVEELKAVKDVSVEFADNTFNAIIGSTGSGKSTLVSMLNGLIKPTSGEILYDDKPIYTSEKVTKEQKKALRDLRCRVGLVFQYPEYQLFEENVLKDVMFGPKNKGLDEDAAREAAVKALESVGINKAVFDKSPFDLSGGEKRRAAIAGVLAMEPEVLILDEPTAGLDPKGKTEILDLLAGYRKKNNVTVILVSHSMEEVAEYADRVIAMKYGRVILDGKTHEVFSCQEELRKMGLDIPEVEKFAQELGISGAITVSEAAEKIAEKYKNKNRFPEAK